MLGFLPTGRTNSMSSEDPSLVSLFWSLKMDSVERVRQEGLDALKAQIVSLAPESESLLRNLTDFDQLIPAEYSDTFMPRLYLDESCVFLGDCAHATSPQLGQGANLALVDAWVLSESMKMYAKVPDAIRHYDEMRKWRLRFYQMNSRLLTPVFQSDYASIGCLRDAFMGPLCYFPPTRYQMLSTLCGAQNNGSCLLLFVTSHMHFRSSFFQSSFFQS
jgi:2-polyprenyl-6-methoxyphenol hydroxylase-like FAD-dependent oxidoreductase